MRREVVCLFAVLWSMSIFAEDTELNLYRPLTDTSKHPQVEHALKIRGECLQQSQLIKRDDAWRCSAEGRVYDPCFVQPYGSHLEAICPESPWSTRGVQITVATPLDNKLHETLDMSRTFPWAVELINGEKCQAIYAGEQYDGLPIRYRCDKQSELIGHLQRCNSSWKILQHRESGVDTIQITKAWF